jgi:hypothetical protein
VPAGNYLIDSYEVILDAEACLNLFVAQPGNQGIGTFRQQGPDGAFVPGPLLPVLPPWDQRRARASSVRIPTSRLRTM